MKYSLVGKPLDTKISKHDGIFTKSYQEARAKYDAAIRSWDIEFDGILFQVKNNEGIVEQVYLDRRIQNCSCVFFIENQAGTCMHIEAVKSLSIPYHELKTQSHIKYVDSNWYSIQLKGDETKAFVSPAVDTFIKVKEYKTLHFNDAVYDDVNVFKNFDIDLFNFQQESIWLMLKNVRTILTLKMGLGKTLCALACCYLLKQNKEAIKIIIVAPNSLKFQWQREINRFNLGTSIVVNKGSELRLYKNQNFIITSYELLNRHRWFLEQNFDVLIPDEMQKIKNTEGKTFETLSMVRAEFMFGLSGTPIQNSITDLLSLIKIFHAQEFKPEWKFYEEYCDYSKAKLFGIKREKLDKLKLKISRYIVNPTVDYSQFKLPIAKEVLIKTKLNSEQKKIHDNYFGIAQILIARSMNAPLSFSDKMKLNGLLTKARLAATDLRLIEPSSEISEKFSQIQDLLLGFAATGKKIIVFSGWIKCLKLLEPFLVENNIQFRYFTGEQSTIKRDDGLTDFLSEEDIIVLLSTDSGGEGIDGLQLVCNSLIHVEKIWNPGKISQRNGRLVRALQTSKAVNIYKYETNAGIEGMMSDNHERKSDIVREMFSND